MKLTSIQHKLLEDGFRKALTPEQKWQVVLMVIVPFIIGNKLFQERISARYGKPYKIEKTVAEVVLCENSIVLTEQKFWENSQHSDRPLCFVDKLHFKYHDQVPILTEDKLFLGSMVGWGYESWYLDLTK